VIVSDGFSYLKKNFWKSLGGIGKRAIQHSSKRRSLLSPVKIDEPSVGSKRKRQVLKQCKIKAKEEQRQLMLTPSPQKKTKKRGKN